MNCASISIFGRSFRESLVTISPWVLAVKLLLLYAFGQFAGLLSYFSIPDLRRIFYAMGLSSLAFFVAYYAGAVKVAPEASF